MRNARNSELIVHFSFVRVGPQGRIVAGVQSDPVNCFLPSPTQPFLVPNPIGLMNTFYCQLREPTLNRFCSIYIKTLNRKIDSQTLPCFSANRTENDTSNNSSKSCVWYWCFMVCSKCHHSAWLTSPIRHRRNSSPQRPVQHWTPHPSQPPSNSTLEAIRFQKTEETPAIRSAPQIHYLNLVYSSRN
jgi:hypothetical protein